MTRASKTIVSTMLMLIASITLASSPAENSIIYGPVLLGSKLDYVELKKLGDFKTSDGPYGDKTITFEQSDLNDDYQWVFEKPIDVKLTYFNLRLLGEELDYPPNNSILQALLADSGYHGYRHRENDCWRSRSTSRTYAIFENRISVGSTDLRIAKLAREFNHEPVGPPCRQR